MARPYVNVFEYDCARGKVNTGGDGRGGEDCVEQSGAHQVFDGELPGGHVSGVVRGDAAAKNYVPVSVATHLRVLLDESFEYRASRVASLGDGASAARGERGLRGRLVAATTRREEDDCGQKVVGAERGEED